MIISSRKVYSLVTLHLICNYILGRDDNDSDSGGSSAVAIAGGATGGTVGVFIIVTVIIVIGYFGFYKNKGCSL